MYASMTVSTAPARVPTYVIIVPSGDTSTAELVPTNPVLVVSPVARSKSAKPGSSGAVVSGATVSGSVAGTTPAPSSLGFRARNTTAATAIAATNAKAPIFCLRAVPRIRRSCSAHESMLGSVCCLTISKTSLRSGMRAS
jgi:hypothetical protein